MRAVHEYSSNYRFIMDRITLSNNKASHDRVKNYEGTKVQSYEGTFIRLTYLRTLIFNSIVTRLVVRQCNPVHYKPRITATFVNCTHSLASVV